MVYANTLDSKSKVGVAGDEHVASAWRKYLSRRDEVESVNIYHGQERIDPPVDVIIHFHPATNPRPGFRNVLYLQNAFNPEQIPGGTMALLDARRSSYQGFMCTSQTLLNASKLDGAVVPFGIDPDFFRPVPDSRFEFPVSFVGNSIRGPIVDARYLEPAIPLGLALFSGSQWFGKLATVLRGKLPMEDLPRVYTNSFINLNAHLTQHLKFGTINSRIFEVLGCRGFVLSDYSQAVEEEFGDVVAFTRGHEDMWAKIVELQADRAGRERRAEEGYRQVLSRHTMDERAGRVVKYLKQLCG
jgi:hypothetical protein